MSTFDLINIGMAFAPMPGAGATAAGAARWLPGLMRREAPTAEALASRSASLYTPPVKPPRPFSDDYRPADYPHGALADAGRLTHDIEGRPLVARYVVGRRMVGGPDEPLGAPEVVAAATQATGRSPQAATSREIGGNAGLLVKTTDRRSGHSDYDLFWNRGLSPIARDRVVAHEFGHLVDDTAGRIPVAGLNTELRQVYNTLNTGQERTRRLTGPQHVGYRDDEVSKELMAEAIRAYLADPNYLKTVAPGAAARIREYVNSHPELSKIIQFNTLAGPVFFAGNDPEPPTSPSQFEPGRSP